MTFQRPDTIALCIALFAVVSACVDAEEIETEPAKLAGDDIYFIDGSGGSPGASCVSEGTWRRIYFRIDGPNPPLKRTFRVFQDHSTTASIPGTITYYNSWYVNSQAYTSVSNCQRDLGCLIKVTLDSQSDIAEDDETNNYAEVYCACQTNCSDGI